MTEKIYDVAGIGSPLVDYTIEVDDSILQKLQLSKGQMNLIDEDKSRDIFSALKNFRIDRTPGGSSSNTLSGLSVFGGKGVLFGKVGNDADADFYISETEKSGVKSGLSHHNSMTGHAITFITPDSERPFATHLGAALQIRKNDISEVEVSSSRILHLEGYLFEMPEIREAAIHAMDIAKKNNVKISIDLADPGLIGRIPDILRTVVNDYADIVFANEFEANAMTGKDGEEALNVIAASCETAIVKLGAIGSLIKHNNVIYRIPAYKADVINTNGAGDMYASGLLYGISRNIPMDKSGRIASYASSLVVAQTSTRLNKKIDIDEIK
jgi:sugar/nucleoside kinase (ribokinase family)